MTRRQLASILVCAAIVYACAPRNRASANDEPARQANPASVTADTSERGLALALSETTQDGALTFALDVKNTGRRTEVRFANGRTHDFVVVDASDREVWRWSEGRLFTQALQTKQLKAGGTFRYEATWNDARPGTYRVIASLNSDTNPVRIERQFTVTN
jgi:hypothetical protein